MIINKDYNIAKETFFGVGGKVDYFVELHEEKDFKELFVEIEGLKERKILVVGACSNILISDKGFDGVVIKNSIKGITVNNNVVEIGAGEMLPKVSLELSKLGFGGFEHLGNIPGTVGGGIRGNVEAHKQSISDNLLEVNWCGFDGKCLSILKKECDFEYRGSIFKKEKNGSGIILSVVFSLEYGDAERLLKTINDDRKKRFESQPSDRSCGCFFKNITLTNEYIEKIRDRFGDDFVGDRKEGENFSAGLLIDKIGLKGQSVGGAKVSEIHANFLINYNSASAQDIYNLYKLVKKRVYEDVGIVLENEVMIVGEFAN